ncbi:multicopper oxidase domain-containing protein [Amnibacterium sp. CER49]|uniref:multicopper oxidase domain-containing protein n=1 Tax=Amnibacterium sp. CER49 TaxID=3039161 RepID=UPI00244C52D7|nr:multicopper oxidase domain-containing protein [Amnibacterium sp. CER49]MDH2445205.1 multicopper oxidase domain-containing protein [Amnibacterium sp. CER49]
MASEDLRDTGVWRYPAIAACLVAAIAHLPVTPSHLREAAYLGVLFVLLELACVALALLLQLRSDRLVALLVAGLGAAAIIAYVVSRSIGLPLVRDDIGNWADPLGVLSVAAEAAMVGFGVAGWSHRREARPLARRAGLAGAAAILGAGLAMTVVAASADVGAAGTGGMGTAASDSYWAAVGGSAFSSDGVTRTYYIEADEVVWDYAPTGSNQVTGKPFDDVAATYAVAGPGRIGPKYLKCLYRGYTDAAFAHLRSRPASEQYLGLLGPVIHAAVGDTIKVVFKNECPFPTSMHPHGVFYAKDSEGAGYNDGTSGADRLDDGVPKGGTHTYTWKVPQRAGPGPADGSSVMWMYHSHTAEVADTYAGLMGPMVVTRAGQARADGSPKDVDREVFMEFFIDNEMASPLLADNVKRYLKAPVSPDLLNSEQFAESNLKHSINGYLFGNMPMPTVRKGQHVRWYVMDMGTEADLHTPHWHGNDVTVNGMRMDVVSLLPAGMVVADMVPDDVGTWLFHCHVNDHITAGMISRYRVTR